MFFLFWGGCLGHLNFVWDRENGQRTMGQRAEGQPIRFPKVLHCFLLNSIFFFVGSKSFAYEPALVAHAISGG